MSLFQSDGFYHLESSARRYPRGREVQSIGYFTGKKEWIRTRFSSQNFSFILSGRGFYELEGRLHPVEAPMVITQSPSVPVYYGPDREWEELFIIYPGSEAAYYRDRELLTAPMWKIRQQGEILKQIRDLVYLLQNQESLRENSDFYDRVDMSAEKLIFSSRQEALHPRKTELQIFVQQLYAGIEEDCSRSFDFHRMAEERGFSSSSFRRCWEDFYSIPPGQTVIELRMRRACRQLAESDRSIREIAISLGYDDPLYFSRLFSRKRQESPGAYRKRTRTPYLGTADRNGS